MQPREAQDDCAVRQSGDIQGNGFCVVAWGSELGWEVAGDGACSWGTAINELDRDRLGMGVGRDVVVRQDLGIDEVAGCPGVDQHPDRYRWEVLRFDYLSTELRFELFEEGVDAGVVRPGGEGLDNCPELDGEV